MIIPGTSGFHKTDCSTDALQLPESFYPLVGNPSRSCTVLHLPALLLQEAPGALPHLLIAFGEGWEVA